jgi:glutathione S-transferase
MDMTGMRQYGIARVFRYDGALNELKENAMQWTAWTTLVALVVYFWMLANVGRARGKYQVKAPATDGPLEFQSILRVQVNTVEQMIMFLPALWMCAFYFSDRWAALGGAVWIIGRILFALAYYKDPAKRSLGFALTMLGTFGLMIATVVGLFTY